MCKCVTGKLFVCNKEAVFRVKHGTLLLLPLFPMPGNGSLMDAQIGEFFEQEKLRTFINQTEHESF